MAAYDRNYDYGMRGYQAYFAARDRINRPPNRVVARYNLDYVVGERGPRYPRNPYPYTGDRVDRVGDLRYYQRPYLTTGGTRTFRGATEPIGYDYGYRGYDANFNR